MCVACCRYGEFMNDFFTISKESVFEETEKRSKFISYSFKVSTHEDVKEKLNSVKSKHWDAKHHVYAYVLNNGACVKFSDDGEPGGTAGLPVLNAIQSENLKNTLVVVVRYFGGILLGTSGLRLMYHSGAENVLKISGRSHFTLCKKLCLEVSYSKYGAVLNILECFGAKVLKTDFLDNVKIEIAVPKTNFDSFKDKVFQISECGIDDKSGDEYIDI